jgi:hypothetical protein
VVDWRLKGEILGAVQVSLKPHAPQSQRLSFRTFNGLNHSALCSNPASFLALCDSLFPLPLAPHPSGRKVIEVACASEAVVTKPNGSNDRVPLEPPADGGRSLTVPDREAS